MAERHAALHAARALLAQLDERQRLHELAVVVHALGRRALGRLRALQLQKGAELAHYAAASAVSVSAVKKPSPPVDIGLSRWSPSARL